MKRLLSLLAATILIISAFPAKADSLPDAVTTNSWYQDERSRLTVGNPTPMEGKFSTTLWGGSTSDLDVHDLLHDASPVCWDQGLNRFRFDKRVVEDAVIFTDGDGNRVYLLALTDSLLWSDGTRISVQDYAFSLLLQMDPAVKETGGTPKDFSWLAGAEDYLSHKTKALAGVRIIGGDMLQITVKKEALPYFYELNRLNFQPYPIDVIAPGTEVLDDGEGIYLSTPLTAENLETTMLDENTGYLSHPAKVSGPYVLASFNRATASFAINPYYKGTEEGMIPRIGRITYVLAENRDMINRMKNREIDLLDKVTQYDSIKGGIQNVADNQTAFTLEAEPRTGLTMIWFMDSSEKVQSKAVREAIACSCDRDTFAEEYVGAFGIRADAFCGQGQWMYNKAQADDGLRNITVYSPNQQLAGKLLEEAGITELDLTLAVPDKEDPTEVLQDTLVKPLREIGINVTIVPVSMEILQDAYEGRNQEYDMLYLGEDFTIIFDPEILKPHTKDNGSELIKAKQELYSLAQDMVRTEPEDIEGFIRKWVILQEEITKNLPLLPVYTNTYFDFWNRNLHGFSITDAVTWSEAIVKSYMSDVEELPAAEIQQFKNFLSDIKEQMK